MAFNAKSRKAVSVPSIFGAYNIVLATLDDLWARSVEGVFFES